MSDKIIHKTIWCSKGFQPVKYAFCPSKKAWKKQMKFLGIKDEPYPTSAGRITTVTDGDGEKCCIMTLRDGIEKNLDLTELSGLFVHEATHIWQDILEQIKEDEPGPEIEAYSMQAIYQELITAYVHTRRCPRMVKYLTMRS